MQEHTTLYFREGSSDKEYRVHLVPVGKGWIVTFEFGRRGGSLKSGRKTDTPLPYEQAKRVFDRLVQEKTAKGYTPGESGVPFTGTEHAGEATAHRPQLPLPAAHVEGLLDDPSFCAQEKFDGERVLIEKAGDEVTGINRLGLKRPLPTEVVALALGLPDIVLDGELVGSDYHVFDLPQEPGPYSHRLARLAAIWGSRPGLVRTAFTAEQKKALLAEVTARRGEGLVFKRRDAPYRAGRNGDQQKHKLTASASCIVTGANPGVRSVQIAVRQADGALRGVGNVTVPANQDVPRPGAIVEVRYLYAFPQGSLFQPVLLGSRTDIDDEDCVESQLKFKAGAEDDSA